MAVTDDRWAGPRESRTTTYDRQPPQDLPAEQSVLGGMLLSKDAIADVVESVRAARLLQAGPRAGLRRDRRPVLPG